MELENLKISVCLKNIRKYALKNVFYVRYLKLNNIELNCYNIYIEKKTIF